MVRSLAARIALAAFALMVPAAAAAQDTPAPPARYPYEFGASSVPMVRNAQLFGAAGAVADRAIGTVLDEATGHLFERHGTKPALARIARLWFLDMPIASLAQSVNHEYGHITRDPFVLRHFVHIDTWPWPLPIAGPRIDGDWSGPGDADVYSRLDTTTLGAIGGGSEASHVLADTLIERAYGADRASYFDLVLYVYGKLDPSAYAIAYSGPSRPRSDPWAYATVLSYLRSRPFSAWPEDPEILFSSARTAAWLNLLDYALVGSIDAVVVDYVIGGHPVVRPRWLSAGPVRLVPGFNYTPTPRGEQYRINCRVGVRATTANLYVRWTQPLQADDVRERALAEEQRVLQRYHRQIHIAVPTVVRLLGIGGQWQGAAKGAFAPTITADAWRDIDNHFGGRAELGVTYRQPWLGADRALRVAVGGKSTGYVIGFPDSRGMYVTAALRADF